MNTFLRLLLAAIGLAACTAALAQDKFPQGWRLPEAAETANAGDAWRERSADKFLAVAGDFDGDGKPDTARLLVNADGTQYGLFVFLGAGKTVRLDQQGIAGLRRMGISLLPPGDHATACGKGYRACKPGEADKLHIRTPGIMYFLSESAASAFVWNKKGKRFLQVSMSD